MQFGDEVWGPGAMKGFKGNNQHFELGLRASVSLKANGMHMRLHPCTPTPCQASTRLWASAWWRGGAQPPAALKQDLGGCLCPRVEHTKCVTVEKNGLSPFDCHKNTFLWEVGGTPLHIRHKTQEWACTGRGKGDRKTKPVDQPQREPRHSWLEDLILLSLSPVWFSFASLCLFGSLLSGVCLVHTSLMLISGTPRARCSVWTLETPEEDSQSCKQKGKMLCWTLLRVHLV